MGGEVRCLDAVMVDWREGEFLIAGVTGSKPVHPGGKSNSTSNAVTSKRARYEIITRACPLVGLQLISFRFV